MEVNHWFYEQKLHEAIVKRINLLSNSKSSNYSELTVVYVADIWRERERVYLGRAYQQVKTVHEKCFTILCGF